MASHTWKDVEANMAFPEQGAGAAYRIGRLLDDWGSVAVPVAAVALWTVCVGISQPPGPGTGPLPEFHAIQQVAVKKQRFFDYLEPVVEAENARIGEQRERLLDIAGDLDDGAAPGWLDQAYLEDLARDYRLDPGALDTDELLDRLLLRVDVVPESLVLVQAAKESGWGSSRFARQANNLFGQWCFEAGCGVVPSRRTEGKTHEVRSFDSVRASVASYLRNLNTNASFREFREMRAELREANQPLSGRRLADGLGRYSERGEVYVREVKAMIRQNDLESAVADRSAPL